MAPLTVHPSFRLFVALAIAVPAVTFFHEFGHHLVAAVECGGIGRVVFTQFQERDGCRAIAGNIAGPAISFVFLWAGVLLLARAGWRMVGLALVIGSIPILRVASVMSGGDDWNYTARLLTGSSYIGALTTMVLLIVLPALVITWRRVAMRAKWLMFPATLVLPMVPALLAFSVLDERVFMVYVKHPERFHQPTALGAPVWVLVGYGTVLALYVVWAHGTLRRADVVRDLEGRAD
ncbi:MAG: hypothetical protein U0163_04280 [Gemmatimonadaceae bacterium]